MNPQLIKYSQETDISISLARRKNRRYLFQMSQQNVNSNKICNESNIEPYKEQFNQRVFVSCENIRFRLQAPIDKEESLCQVEPYFTTLSVYDARNNKKISENFYFNINHEAVQNMIKSEDCTEFALENIFEIPSDLKDIPVYWLKAKQAIFNITNPHPDIFLVLKIDKILQGNIYQACEPYVRAGKDPRLGMKVHKQVQAYFQRYLYHLV